MVNRRVELEEVGFADFVDFGERWVSLGIELGESSFELLKVGVGDEDSPLVEGKLISRFVLRSDVDRL